MTKHGCKKIDLNLHICADPKEMLSSHTCTRLQSMKWASWSINNIFVTVGSKVHDNRTILFSKKQVNNGRYIITGKYSIGYLEDLT